MEEEEAITECSDLSTNHHLGSNTPQAGGGGWGGEREFMSKSNLSMTPIRHLLSCPGTSRAPEARYHVPKLCPWDAQVRGETAVFIHSIIHSKTSILKAFVTGITCGQERVKTVEKLSSPPPHLSALHFPTLRNPKFVV